MTPSPIVSSNPSLQGDELAGDLRHQALQTCLGGEAFSNILPEIHRRLGGGDTPLERELSVERESSSAGMERLRTGVSAHVPLARGIAGEFNEVVSFRVPVSQGQLRIRGYFFDSPSAPTGGWNSDSTFTPQSTNSMRFHNLYEVHVRRVGDEYVYTVALTHGFVGGLRIDSGAGSTLLLSHQFRRSPNTTASSGPSEQPNPSLTDTTLSAPSFEVAATLGTPPPLTSGVSGGSGSNLSAPTNSTANGRSLQGQSPELQGNPRSTLASGALEPPALPDRETSTESPTLSSNELASGGSSPAPSNLTSALGARPRISETPSSELPSELPPPRLASDNPPDITTAPGSLVPAGSSSSIADSGQPPRLTSSLPGQTPQASGLPASGQIAAPLSPPFLSQEGNGREQPPTLTSNHTAGSSDGPSPDRQPTNINGQGPVVAMRVRYNAPQFPLPPYIPPTIETNEDNRLRALALSVLGEFTIRPMHDMAGGVRLPDTDAANTFFADIVDACYYLPETAFGHLSRFTNPQQAEDRHPADSLETLSDALVGTGNNPPARGGSAGAPQRISEISTYLQNNQTLAQQSQTELREIRLRLVSLVGPLRWTSSYVDARQMEEARASGETVRTALPSSLRPDSHHPLTFNLQRTFRSIFGEQSTPSTHLWGQLMTSIQSLNPNQLESVGDMNTHDVLTIRSLLLTARRAQRDPAFRAHFLASRETSISAQVLPLLAPSQGTGVAETPLLTYFTNTFGAQATQTNRSEILRLTRSLNGNNTLATRIAVNSQLVALFREQTTFGTEQLDQLDQALTRLESYNDRLRLLLRARAVGEETDVAIGSFLSILPDTPGTPARANPSQADFETRLTRALNAIESEYALLRGDAVGGTYASSRMEILRFRLRDLREHLCGEGKEGEQLLAASPAARALRARLILRTPREATPASLPIDPISVVDGLSSLFSLRFP